MASQHVKVVIVNSDGSEFVMRHSHLTNKALDALTHSAQVLENASLRQDKTNTIVDDLNSFLEDLQSVIEEE